MPDARRRLQHRARLRTVNRTALTAPAIAVPDKVAAAVISRLPVLATISLGLVVLYFIGFSPIQRVHNAAHDTRHANGFACH
jgi:cobalt transporter subunit CbtB